MFLFIYFSNMLFFKIRVQGVHKIPLQFQNFIKK